MVAPLIQLERVTKRYDARQEAASQPVLAEIDLEVASGESIAIVGPSGSGKSTLLNIIGALLPPTSGVVRFDGVDLASLDADGLAALRNTSLGFVFQSHHLLPQCTAIENVLVPTLVLADPVRRRAAAGRAERLLQDVGLGDRLTHRPSQLSGGECQRVAVVRALINEPRVVLADEPTGSLDGKASEQLADILCALNETESVALVTVTHSVHLAGRMQRRYELRDGRLHALEVAR